MKQLNLELKNYRKFKVLHLNFHPRFTLLTGINGSGKSSVLHGIWHSWQPMITRMRGKPRTQCGEQSMVVSGRPTLKDVHRSDSVEVSPESWQTAPLPQFPLHAVGSFSLGHVEEGCVGITLRRTESSCHSSNGYWFSNPRHQLLSQSDLHAPHALPSSLDVRMLCLRKDA